MKQFLILFISFYLINISLSAEISWINNANQYNFLTPNNWDVNRVPVLNDDVLISPNNAYVFVNGNSQFNSLNFITPSNGTMVIAGKGSISMNTANIMNNPTISIDSTSKTAAFQSNLSTNIVGKLNIKSGIITANNLNMADSKINLVSGIQTINSNFIFFTNSKIDQVASQTLIKAAARFSGSSLACVSSSLNSDNKGVFSTVHSSNLTFTSSSFKTDNYMVFESSNIKLTSSSMIISSLSFTQGTLSAEASTISFDKIFHTMSPQTITMKKFSILQSTSGSQFVAAYRSSIYLENIILMMNGKFILRDNAVLTFGGLILPLLPVKIQLNDNSKVKYAGLFNFNKNSLQEELDSLSPEDSIGSFEDREISSLTFELNGNSEFESNGQDLQNVNIINNENGSIQLSNLVLSNSSITSNNGLNVNSNIVLNGSTIESDVTNTGSISGTGKISGNVNNQGNIGSLNSVSKIVIDGTVTSSPDSTISILVNSEQDYTQIQVRDSLVGGSIVIQVSESALLNNNEFHLITYGNQDNSQLGNIVVQFENNKQVNYTLVSKDSQVSLQVKVRDEPVTKKSWFIAIISVGCGMIVIGIAVGSIMIHRSKKAKKQENEKGVKLEDNNNSIDISN